MTSLRRALLAALQPLLRGKSLLLQALLACWGRRPAALRRRGRRRYSATRGKPDGYGSGAHFAHADAVPDQEAGLPVVAPTVSSPVAFADPAQPLRVPGAEAPSPDPAAATTPPKTSPSTSTTASVSPTLPHTTLSANTTASLETGSSSMPSSPSPSAMAPPSAPTTTPEAFLREAEELLLRPVQGAGLRRFARRLLAQLRTGLRTSPASMLPSHTTQLPTGHERGRYLTLDVGGSTLRVAVIALEDTGLRILQIQSFKITPAIKQLPGTAFFDWMAARIVQTVDEAAETFGGVADGDVDGKEPLPMGLAWSFPLEQTSARNGHLQGMGKGFVAADTLLGRDLGDLIEAPCRARGLAVRLAAIVNDAPAALLSTAYAQPAAARFGLILGTGVNMSVHVPVAAVGQEKLAGGRNGAHVLVNTELGMFGGHGILPLTRWDARLNAGHPKPDFQPLEHMVSGYYLGEVCRFALLDAIATAGVFGGVAPPSLLAPYSLDTETLSRVEEASTDDLAAAIFHRHHPSAVPPTSADMAVVRALAALVAQRSAALVAAAIYALWALKFETETERVRALEAAAGPTAEATEALLLHRAERDSVRAHTVVGFNGSVIERYPHYRERCQAILDGLLLASSSSVDHDGDGDDDDTDHDSIWDQLAAGPVAVVDLVPAPESSLQGAAVALACLGA